MYKLEIKPSKTLHTIYGNSNITSLGYYRITSVKEGNCGKMLHRLIWERWYGELQQGRHIHHIDGNPLNNCIWNLEPMSNSEHNYLHNINKKPSEESCLKKSEARNTTGYFRVYKQKSKRYKQGFIWAYKYYEDGKNKAIYRVKLKDLEKEVKRRKLKWKKLKKGGDCRQH